MRIITGGKKSPKLEASINTFIKTQLIQALVAQKLGESNLKKDGSKIFSFACA